VSSVKTFSLTNGAQIKIAALYALVAKSKYVFVTDVADNAGMKNLMCKNFPIPWWIVLFTLWWPTV
jgi:hypothetical protein